jgi:hypothetical protein
VSNQTLNVYVSGFHDWPDNLQDAYGFDRWRCVTNPSGRLFVGEWFEGVVKPDASRGELPRALREMRETSTGRPIEWHFATLPVVWGVGASIAVQNFDVVVNVGLGGCDDLKTISLEKGAFNGRIDRADAAAIVPGVSEGTGSVINEGASEFRPEPEAQAVKLDKLKGPIGATGYVACPLEARRDNAFVCNETHDFVLRRLGTGARPFEGYFIHIPKPPADDGYHDLTVALAHIIRNLLG